MTNKPNQINLLPNYFKKIGVIIILIAFGVAIVIKTFAVEFIPSHKEFSKIVTLNLFILGVLLVAWAKDKFEDELTMLIRLKAIGFTFISAVSYVICKSLVDLAWGNAARDLNGQELVSIMLFVYIIYCWILKKGR